MSKHAKTFSSAMKQAHTAHESSDTENAIKALKTAKTAFAEMSVGDKMDYADEVSDYEVLLHKYKRHLKEDEQLMRVLELAGLPLAEKFDASADVILKLAKKHFSVKTLETRNSDSLDFYDVSVGSIKAALEEAYSSGYKDGYNQAPKGK